MGTLLATILSLPRWAQGMIAAAVLVAGFLVWLALHDRAVVREHEREVAEETRERTDEADAAARERADAVKSEIEHENDEAREAAAGSDDPLRDALKRLRAD